VRTPLRVPLIEGDTVDDWLGECDALVDPDALGVEL